MKTPVQLRQLVILCMQMITFVTSLLLFPQKRLSVLQPIWVKCFSLLFILLVVNNSNVFAQAGSFDSTQWISPDVPREQAALRPLAARPSAQAQILAVPTSPNPDVPQSLLCQDLRVIFVLDESNSINAAESQTVRAGARALANALLNSGATLQLIEFNTTSTIVNLGGTLVNSTFIANLNAYLGNNPGTFTGSGFGGQTYNPTSPSSCIGWTNWQAALISVASVNADLVLFFTDGSPTAYNNPSGGCTFASGNVTTGVPANAITPALDPAITQANTVKGQAKHIFVVGVGLDEANSLSNIQAISGTDEFGPSHDILTADYTTPPFESLAANLSAAVNAICGTEILVDKTASNSGVCSGQSVIFTNTVTNTGGDFNFTALSVVAKDVYPNGYSSLQFVPSAPSGASISGNTVTYNIGDMAAGQSVTYQIQATVLAPVPPKNYNNVISATAFNANEARDSVTVISGYATAEKDITSCVPVVINGTTYSSNGTYTQTLVSAAGCDSVLTIKVTISEPTSSSETVKVCDTYTWPVNGTTYTQSGTYTSTSTSAEGCVHTTTLNLTIDKSTSNTTTASACDNYTWALNGATYTTGGTYTVTSTNAAGCTHTETLILTINKSTSNTTTASACDSYIWAVNGATYTTGGTYTVTSTNADGCPHTETLNLTINKSTSNTTTASACDNYTWAVDGVAYTTGGTYTVTSTNAAGCPHTETLNLTINKSTSNTTTAVACSSYTWAVNGVTYTAGGTYSVNSTNAAGCPHTETLNLTINNNTSNTTTASACDSYTWPVNNAAYTESGTYTSVSTNQAGCTHTETLILTINKSTSNSTPVIACDTYTWPVNGATYTTGGTYSFTSTNPAGCTHTETLELTINNSTSNTTTATACDSYTWAVNGTVYTVDGRYTATSTNAAGCTHTEILQLTINNSTSNTTEATACDSYTWDVNGVTYTTGGTYSVTSTNAAGCTHTETLVLTINKSTSNTTTVTECDSYIWAVNGVTYTEGGTYSVASTNPAGCTHTETLVLTINKSTSNSSTVVECNSYTWPVNGVTYTTGGTYSVTSTNAAGCTHTETLVLGIGRTTTNTTTVVECDSYTWPVNGVTYTTGGSYSVTSTNQAGCTHTEKLELTINTSTSNTTPVTACDTYTWAVNGVTYTGSGTYAVTSTNAAGCTHTETLELKINKSTSNTTTESACDSYTWAVNGVAYTSGGTYTVISTNAAGCPHTEILELTINKSTSNTTTTSACNSYTWPVNGTTYTSGGTYTATSINAAGCTHIETLVLTINKGTTQTTTATACDSYRWAVNGVTYICSGTYIVTTNNSYGCATTQKLVLTIKKSTSNTTTTSACNSYKWLINGVTYTASGTYIVTSTNYAGCTHTEKLVLTINKSTSTTTTITACNSYKWSVNGATYTASGTYTTTSTNSSGCACTHKLVLTINKAPGIGAISGPVKVCRNQTGVSYSVAAVSGATSYTWVLPTGATGSSSTNSIAVAFGSAFSSGYIKVKANNSCGSSAYSQITVAAPTAAPSSCGTITGTRLICAAGNNVYSIPAVAGATNYVWSVTGTGLSIISGQGTPSVTVAATSSFVSGTVSVKATNCVGSSGTVTLNVSGSKIPAKPGAISGPVAGVCKKTNVTYSVAVVSGATSYTWIVPSGVTIISGAGTNSIKVTFGASVTGSCSISVKANNACGSSAASSLAISTAPAQPGAISGLSSVTRSSTAVVYSVVAVPDATSYTWTISGGAKFVGSATGNAVKVNFATATSTAAVITVKANNACGSSAASSKTIAVSTGYAARGVNNGAESVDEMTKAASDFVVYPNPGNGQFNVSFNTKKMDKVAIRVTDLTGRTIYQSANTYAEGPQLSKVNISKFTSGIYLVQILRNNEIEKVLKVIMEK